MDEYNIVNEDSEEIINNAEEKEERIEIIIDISNDYYEAFMTIKSEKEEIVINKEDIIEALNKKNVVYGLKNDVIDSIIENPKHIIKLSIAEGKRHQNGEDGKIEYLFDVDSKKKPKLLPNGTVDHKELNYILKVSKGDILAKKILPTQSKNGITVTGRTIKGKPGKYVDFKKGKNASLSEEGTLLVAEKNGIVEFKDEKVSVIEVLEINEDVGITTGNISFDGKIIVKGNVASGYVINSQSDIEIFGIVEGSEIIGKDIIIHRGVHNNAKLIAEGNITTHFMENCYAKAKGDVVCDTIIHCNINSLGKVNASEKKGLIIGGNLKVRKEIIAKTIGSQIGSITKIQLGIDEELLMNIKNTKELLEENKAYLKKINQALNILHHETNRDSKKEMILDKYSKSKDHYSNTIKALEKKMKEQYTLVDSLKNSKISSNQIYPGTNIIINSSYYVVKKLLTNVKLMKEDGEVVIFPLL